MSSDQTRVVINSRQRLRSEDFNRQARLRARSQIQETVAFAQDLGFRGDSGGIGGVVGGFEVDCVAGTLNARIYPGIGLLPATPTDPDYDPPQAWLEIRKTETIDLSSFVDLANPRLITIELEAVDDVIATEQRDVFDPNTGLFTTAALDVVKGSRLTATAPYTAGGTGIIVTAGVPGVTPQVAVGTPGRLPIAIIKLSAALANFSDQFVAVLQCRPILAASGRRNDAAARTVEGGGISVGEIVGGGIGNTNICSMHDSRVELLGLDSRQGGQVEFTGGFNVRTPDTTSEAALVASVQTVYAYAAPAPWATDYGAIAPREAIAPNPNGANRFATPESVVQGTGPTFVSLAGSTPTAGDSIESSVIIWDTLAPSGIGLGPGGAGSPRIEDLRGTHPTIAGGAALNLVFAQDPTWGSSQVVTDAVYLGSVGSLGAGNFMGQSYRGGGYIRVIDQVDTGANNFRPFVQVTGSAAFAALYPGNYPAMLVGDGPLLPAFATQIEVFAHLVSVALTGTVHLTFRSAFGFGGGDLTAVGDLVVINFDAVDNANGVTISQSVALDRDNTGAVQWSYADGIGIVTSTVWLDSYRDPFLGSR